MSGVERISGVYASYGRMRRLDAAEGLEFCR
jgi:hypothetical protein